MARPKATATETVHITPAKVEEIGLEVWGERWREEITKFLGISYSQLHRYMTIYKGQQIPKVVAVALIMRRQFLHDNALPNFDAFAVPAAEAKPVKFVQVAKPKPEKPDFDAPVANLFGEEEVKPVEEKKPETPKAEEPAKAKPKATTKAGQGRKPEPDRGAKTVKAAKPVAKPKAEKPAAKPKAEKPAKAAPAKATRKPAPRRKADPVPA